MSFIMDSISLAAFAIKRLSANDAVLFEWYIYTIHCDTNAAHNLNGTNLSIPADPCDVMLLDVGL